MIKRLQTQYSTGANQGPIALIKSLYEKNGIRGFYQGWLATSMQRSFLAFWFSGNEIAKRTLAGPDGKLSTPASFAAGGFAGACYWSFWFVFLLLLLIISY